MLESIGEAVNKELDSVARSIRCGDTVNRVLTLGMSDDAVALASKFKLGSVLCLYAMGKENLEGRRYDLYCSITDIKNSANFNLGHLVEYVHSRLIENRFKNFGKYDNSIDKSWKAFKKSDKYNIYQNKEISGLYLQLTGVTFKATQSTVDKKDNEGKTDAKTKSIIDDTAGLFKYSGNLALYDFMKTLQDAKCAVVKVNETEKSLAKGIASFCGLEVALPRLICKDSYDLMLDYKRVGIAKLQNKNFIIYRDIYRYLTENFKAKANLTIVCTKESLSTLGDIIGNNDNSVISLDKRVGSVIKSLLGDEFNTSDEMVYFNVCIDSIPFGSSGNKSTIYDTNNNFWDMQYRYFKNRYLADIIHYYWSYHFKGREDDVNEKFSELYKSKSPLLEKLKSVGVDLGYGSLKEEVPARPSIFELYDIRGDFEFYATGKSYYIDSCRNKTETYVLDKSDIDKIFNRIGEDILDEITDEPASGLKIASGISDDAGGLVCLYELEYGAALGFCHKIFKNASSENKFTLNNYLRDKYEEHNELADDAILEIVNLMYNSLTSDGKIAVGNNFEIEKVGKIWKLSGENSGFMEFEYNRINTSIEPINSEKNGR